jgi:hypothetical protein
VLLQPSAALPPLPASRPGLPSPRLRMQLARWATKTSARGFAPRPFSPPSFSLVCPPAVCTDCLPAPTAVCSNACGAGFGGAASVVEASGSLAALLLGDSANPDRLVGVEVAELTHPHDRALLATALFHPPPHPPAPSRSTKGPLAGQAPTRDLTPLRVAIRMTRYVACLHARPPAATRAATS